MAEFSYTAINQNGNEVRGSIDAKNIKTARELLTSQSLTVTTIKKEAEMTWEEYFSGGNRKIGQKDLLMFTKYFSVLTKAGIPILKALVILEKQVDNLRLQKRIKKIREGIESGSNLCDMFAKFPDTFPPMYLNLVRIGEESGMLFDMLEKLGIFLTKSQQLKSKVKGAMVYPVVIIFVAGGIVIFLMAFVIPRFADMFKSFKAELPLPTKIVMAISDFVKGYIIFEVIGFFAAIWAIKAFHAWPIGRQIWDKVALKVPLVGSLVIKYSTQAFCMNLSTLLKSGISISRALEITNNAIENVILKEEIAQVKVNVEAGMSIGDAIEKVPSIPNMVVQMISVGDQTGTLENMLENIAEFYEEEIENLVDALTSLIEPIFIVFLGFIVGGIVISMFLPILQMSKAVSH